MNKTRLQHLIHVAEHIDMKRLDMELWGACGTHACLAGWACQDKQFSSEGLTLVDYKGGMVPTYNGEHAFKALDKFFDLQGLETTHLFSPIAYSAKPSRAELLEHINDILSERFIKEFGAYPKYLDARIAHSSNRYMEDGQDVVTESEAA